MLAGGVATACHRSYAYFHGRGLIETQTVPQAAICAAGMQLACTEGIITSPELCHDLRVAIDEGLSARNPARPNVSWQLTAGVDTLIARR